MIMVELMVVCACEMVECARYPQMTDSVLHAPQYVCYKNSITQASHTMNISHHGRYHVINNKRKHNTLTSQ